MKIYWMWLILSIGGMLDLALMTWNFPMKRGRGLLEAFYGIFIPLAAGWKLYLVFQGKSLDKFLILLIVFLIWGTWRISEIKFEGILIAFAFLYIGGAMSELIALGIIQSMLGIPVLPMNEARGSMACMMAANGLMLLYVMAGNWFWKRYGQGKRISRHLLLFFLVLVQMLFLFWIVYAGCQGEINITFGLLAGVVIMVFGTMSFSYVQIHGEEIREEEKRLKKMELQVQKEFEQFQELGEKERMLQQIRHDFNNQLSMVYYLSREGKKEQAGELLDDMEQMLSDGGNRETGTRPFSEIQLTKEAAGEGKNWGRQVFLLPAGQVLLFPAILQILTAHGKSWWLLADAAIFFLKTGTDGLWMFIVINQRRRKKRNEQMMADIYGQQAQQNREKILREGQKERWALQRELLACLKDARDRLEKQGEILVLQEIQKEERRRYCDNDLVNTVLEEKLRECRELDISVFVQTEVPQAAEVKSSHLCSVWTNLLDNGIHACQSLPVPKRWMRIQSKKQGDYLYIRVSNSTSEDYGKRPPAPGHGLGKQILARIAAQYHGEYWTEASDDTYIAAVVLQICRKSKAASKE